MYGYFLFKNKSSHQMIERRSRVHVEVWAHGERLDILNRNMAVTAYSFSKLHHTFGCTAQLYMYQPPVERPRWKKDLKVRDS